MTLKLNTKLPDPDSARNGLSQLSEEIVAHPRRTLVAVVELRCRTIERNILAETDVPVMVISGIEVLTGGYADLALDVLQMAQESRTGEPQLERPHAETAAEMAAKLYDMWKPDGPL
jgi:hypothetical protein